jgi:hypothetical protein
VVLPTCPTITWYIVDVRHYTTEKVHAHLSAEDPGFRCAGGSCGCIAARLLEDLLTAARSKHTDAQGWVAKIDKRIRQRCLGMLSPGHMPSPVSNAEATPEPMHTERLGAARIRTVPVSVAAGVADRMVAHAADIVARAIAVSAGTLNAADAHDAAVSVGWQCADERASLDLVAYPNPTWPLPLFVDRTTFVERHAAGVEMFMRVLLLLAIRVFGVPLAKVAVFWDDTNTIAFNRDSRLFFNLRYFQALFADGSGPADKVLAFWFMLFSHELAHNAVQTHDRNHERVMEAIAVEKMPVLLLHMVPDWNALSRIDFPSV